MDNPPLPDMNRLMVASAIPTNLQIRYRLILLASTASRTWSLSIFCCFGIFKHTSYFAYSQVYIVLLSGHYDNLSRGQDMAFVRSFSTFLSCDKPLVSGRAARRDPLCQFLPAPSDRTSQADGQGTQLTHRVQLPDVILRHAEYIRYFCGLQQQPFCAGY